MAGVEILFEDADLLIVNKPSGVLSESTGGDEVSMLDLVSRYIGRRAVGYHRIDRYTSGCLLFGKNSKFNKKISLMFQGKRVRKEYWAIVDGVWPKGINKVETSIGVVGAGVFANVTDGSGKKSTTTFRNLGKGVGQSWVQCLPKTGRTHQIRLHCLEVGCPIVGDRLYGQESEHKLALHARSIQLPHPGGKGLLKAVAAWPSRWDVWRDEFEVPSA